jgi:hypothetical protein
VRRPGDALLRVISFVAVVWLREPGTRSGRGKDIPVRIRKRDRGDEGYFCKAK